MTKNLKTPESIRERLKGNVMLGRKVTLQRYENLSVNLLIEFYLDESDHVKEATKLTGAVVRGRGFEPRNPYGTGS